MIAEHCLSPESLRVKCLSEDAEPVDPSLDTKKENLQFPGQYIDIDEQCRMVFGPKFSFLNEDMNVWTDRSESARATDQQAKGRAQDLDQKLGPILFN